MKGDVSLELNTLELIAFSLLDLDYLNWEKKGFLATALHSVSEMCLNPSVCPLPVIFFLCHHTIFIREERVFIRPESINSLRLSI